MCIAILNTKKTTLSKQVLKNCWENNGDGAGILYVDGDKMSFFKEMKDFDNFYANYIFIKSKFGKNNIVLHFRISTHGKVNETNCHPFLVNEEIGFVHNGMIYDVPVSKDYSDTYMFNELVLKNFKDGFEYNDVIMDMIEFYIGAGSKLVFLNTNNDYFIVNEKAGHWHMDCWFSNSSYKQVNDYVDFGGIKKYKGSYWSSGASYTTKQYNNSFDWDYEDDSTQLCRNCDSKLYGINEINSQKCDWCLREEEELKEIEASYKNDTCDCCDRAVESSYSSEYSAFICKDCRDEWGLGA